MSGRSFVDKISGGNVTWSWSKSTRSFQSEAPWSKEGVNTGFVHLVSLAPALTKLIVGKDWAVSFLIFRASTSASRAVFRCSNTESCLQVYLLLFNATRQFDKIWCSVPLAFWHSWHRPEFSMPHSCRRSGVLTQLIEEESTNLIICEFELQIKFFQEKSNGIVFSDHFSQIPWRFNFCLWTQFLVCCFALEILSSNQLLHLVPATVLLLSRFSWDFFSLFFCNQNQNRLLIVEHAYRILWKVLFALAVEGITISSLKNWLVKLWDEILARIAAVSKSLYEGKGSIGWEGLQMDVGLGSGPYSASNNKIRPIQWEENAKTKYYVGERRCLLNILDGRRY